MATDAVSDGQICIHRIAHDLCETDGVLLCEPLQSLVLTFVEDRPWSSSVDYIWYMYVTKSHPRYWWKNAGMRFQLSAEASALCTWGRWSLKKA